MDKAIFGLIGVVLGAALAVAKDWWFHRRSVQKEREYLAILIAFSLEKLGSECAEVVVDDGLIQGQYDSDGCRAPQASTPSFNPQSVDVEWKSIPADLMYAILNVVNEIDAADHRIAAAFEYAAGPPDYEEYFDERRISYAAIGMNAFGLAERLRTIGGLPRRDIRDWDPVEVMRTHKQEVENSKSQREARQSKLFDITAAADAQK